MVCRDPILEENKNYWTDRAPGYSEVNRLELATAQRQRWKDCICEELTRRFPDRPLADLQVLEVGTGPGFFAILLRELGCGHRDVLLLVYSLQLGMETADHHVLESVALYLCPCPSQVPAWRGVCPHAVR